tara:strand:- start:8017 stop:8940 length:924 start_codon:yes stop_codon:yes gene_type:complete
MNKTKGVLGRGLASILTTNNTILEKQLSDNKKDSDVVSIGSIHKILISEIVTNPFQPRKSFNQEKLNELATSIEHLGVIQPITVRKMKDKKYQLISGERRFQASQILGLKEIPAFIKIANDKEMLEMALVENIQREDLNPIEIALSYQRLIKEIKLTQEECSLRIGKKRSTVTNFLRLLKLPEKIQKGIIEGKISNGHARALLSIKLKESQINLFYDIIDNGYSVREVEQLAKVFSLEKYKRTSKNKNLNNKIPFSQQKIMHDLSKIISPNIELKLNKKGKGKIIIPFKNNEEFERIIEIIKYTPCQ